MNLKDTYNKIAEDWVKDHQSDDWWVEGTDRFVSLLEKGAHVLDVGCAGGVKSKYLLEQGLRVTGIDLSDKMIEIAKREVPGAEFMAMDLANVSELVHTFDGIFLQAVLLHIPKADAQARIKALAQKLKPGGVFYIAVKAKREGGVDEEIKTEDDYGYTYERFFSYYTPEEMKGYFENIGFKIIYENGADLTHTNWIQIIGQKVA